jgi:hypothetical protein
MEEGFDFLDERRAAAGAAGVGVLLQPTQKVGVALVHRLAIVR